MIRFKNDLAMMDWLSVYQAEGINNKFDEFNSIITGLHNKYFPVVPTEMNEMCDRNSTHKQIDQININNSITEDPQEIANKFNEFFANVGPNLAKS